MKPLGLSGSRGVMRADSVEELEAALVRLRELLMRPEIRALREPMHDEVLVEGFIEGREYALEGVLEQARCACSRSSTSPIRSTGRSSKRRST